MADGGAEPFKPGAGAGGKGGRDKPQRDRLIELAVEGADLWHGPDGTAYATVRRNGRAYNWPLRARDFRLWLADAFYTAERTAAGGQAFEDALRVLEASACYDGDRHRAWVRTAEAGGYLWLDLGGDNGAVRIAADGWHVMADPDPKFIRPRGQRELPVPESGGSIEDLRDYLNVSDAQFALVVAWLLGTFRATGPYPVLVLVGEQGTAKSSATRLLRELIDPNVAPLRSAPREERDLIISASNSYVLALDNLSDLAPWLADALCRIATGGGFATRRLHTDTDEIVLDVQRPVILNGIGDLTSRSDLADRSIVVQLRPIKPDERRTERAMRERLDRERPFLLGALLDLVADALAHRARVELTDAPRMADFAEFVVAAERGGRVPWRAGGFLELFERSRRDVIEAAVSADPLAQAIETLVDGQGGSWTGTATELLDALNRAHPDRVTARYWPKAPNGLSIALNRRAPSLRELGFSVETGRAGDASRRRLIELRRVKSDGLDDGRSGR